MLWEKLSKNKELFSILFVVIFSISALFWNSNIVVGGIASFRHIGDFFSGSLDNLGGLVKSLFQRFQSYEKIKEERDSCLNVMEDYYSLDQQLAILKKENESLRRELGFPPRTDYPTVKAEVLSVRLHTIYRTIIINKGSRHGILPYMPVVARALDNNGKFIEALVGKIIAVGQNTSVVQPLINSNFSMGVTIPNTSLWASLSGNSDRSMEPILEYIDPGIVIDPRALGSFPMGPMQPVGVHLSILPEGLSKIGKVVYSSGGSGVFPPNIPVGYITGEGPREGTFKTAYVRPFVEFDRLEFVTVILKKPDKWIEEWPEERSVKIENPYLGEINFPDEEKMKEQEKVQEKKKKQEIATPSPIESEESNDN